MAATFKPAPWVFRILLLLALAYTTQAYGGRDRGPFGGGHGDDDGPYGGFGTATTTASSSDSTSGSDSDSGSNGGGSSSNGGGASGFGSGSSSEATFDPGFDIDQATHYRTVHGVLAAVAFVAMFPLGASFVRVLPGRAALIMHALAQIIAFLLFICAAALGIWLLVNVKPGGKSLFSYSSSRAHPALGIIILILIFAMPVLGFLHHAAYKRHQRRTTVSHVHIWLGRFLILLGIINGGLGLKQAEASHDVKVGYAIVAAVSGCIWLFFVLFGAWRRKKDVEEREAAAALLAAAGGRRRGGGGDESMVSAPGVLPQVVGVADGGPGGFLGRSGTVSSYGRRDGESRFSSEAVTRRVSEESDRGVQRNKSGATARHDAVSEISSRV